jgi:hypothetical protein
MEGVHVGFLKIIEFVERFKLRKDRDFKEFEEKAGSKLSRRSQA